MTGPSIVHRVTAQDRLGFGVNKSRLEVFYIPRSLTPDPAFLQFVSFYVAFNHFLWY